MAKYIDAEPIINSLTAMKSEFDAITLDGIIKALNEALEVTRCKDCKHYEVRNTGYSYCYFKRGEIDESPVKVYADDYCSYGERKDSGQARQREDV